MIGRIIWYFLKDVPAWNIFIHNKIKYNLVFIKERILKLEQAHIATSKPSVKRKRKSGKHGKS